MRCMIVTLCIIMHADIYVVEDDEDEDNVILVHYYPDEDDEIDNDDVLEIVKNVDDNACLTMMNDPQPI